MVDRKRIAIIGAGMGGLSAAAILSRYADVTVFERGQHPGGKIRQVDAGGRPVDSGPTVFTMDWALESVFEQAGASLRDHVRLSPQALLARHYWPDGTALDLHAEIDASADEMDTVFGAGTGDEYRRFCTQARTVYETLKEPFMEADAPGFLRLVASRSPLSLLQTAPFSTLWSHLTSAFSQPKLRQLFGRYATYCGASPFAAPATLMLVAHVEQSGVWALEGGMQALPNALARVAERNGARMHYGAHVEEIVVAGGVTQGVRVVSEGQADASGTEFRPFDLVVMNGDVAALRSGALGTVAQDAVTHGRAVVRSQSAMTWSALAKPTGKPLSFHTVCFSDDYPAEFKAVFGESAVPDAPTVYLCAPDRVDGAVPDGPERVFGLINAPANGDVTRYSKEEIARCRQRMEAALARCGITLNTIPGTETAATPETFAARFPATGGGLYGMASHGWQASFQRPGVRSRVTGLYLAGGSVHPGPGVPMAALSGRAAAGAIVKDYALTSPSRAEAISGGISTPSAPTVATG